MLARCQGALVEPKGLTASVHYRNVAPELWDEVGRVVEQVVASDADRFVLTSGNRVWEIRPRVAWHKGEALDWIMRHLGDPARRLMFYLGDDRTDEDAFARFPERRDRQDRSSPSSTLARYHLADPAAVERFLGWLAGKLAPAGETTSIGDHQP